MSRLGVLSNRYADGNRGGPPLSPRAGVTIAAPDGIAEIPAALARFAEAGVEVVAVDGGDGTLREVLSALPAAFGDRRPAIALIASGKTNVAARDVGGFGTGDAAVARLAAHLDAGGGTAERHCLEVLLPGRPPVRGFVVGAAMFAHATRMAGAWSHDRGIKQGAGVAMVIARVLAQVLGGRIGPGVARLSIAADGAAPPPPTPHFLFLASTLHRLSLGLRPFPQGGAGELRWLGVDAPPTRLLRQLRRAWSGTVVREPGYAGGGAARLDLALDGALVVDGELYETETATVRLGEEIRFVAPNASHSTARQDRLAR